ISHIAQSFSQNARDLKQWAGAIDAGRLPVCRGLSLSQDDVIRGSAIQSIMCNGTLDFADIARRFDVEPGDYFATEIGSLHALEQDGMVDFIETGVRATSRGRLLLRIIAMCFDLYLPSLTPAAPLS